MRLVDLKHRCIGIAVVCMVVVCGRAVRADDLSVGVVDEDLLDAKYEKFRAVEADIDKKAQDIEVKLAARRWLGDTDAKRFDELIQMDTTTADQNTEMDHFVKVGSDTNAEYLGLAGRVNPSDADTARLKVLKDIEQINQPQVQHLEDVLLDKIKQQQEKTFDQYMNIVNNVLAQVAEEKHLSMIVRKRALIWSAKRFDITDDVLAKLNAPTPLTPLAPTPATPAAPAPAPAH